METYCKLYINKLVNSLKSNIKVKQDNVIFIKHYNALDISQEDVQNNIEDKDAICLLYHQYKSGKMPQPYAPILDWIKQLYETLYQDKVSIDTFLEICQVYSLHRPILKSYIEGKKCRREEDLIVIEVEYEQARFLQSLSNIITYISKEKPVLMVLNRLHLSGSSTVTFLRKFLKGGIPENIAVLATYNEVCPINYYMQNNWRKLLNYIEERNIVFDWGFVETEENSDVQNNFDLQMADMEDYIQTIRTMFYTLALEEAEYYLEKIYIRIQREKFSVTIEQKAIILLSYGMISVYLGNFERTLLLCEGMVSLDILDNPRDKFQYNYLIGLSHVYMGKSSISKSYVEECKKIALEEKQDYWYFKAELLELIAYFRGWNNIFLFDFTFEIDDTFLNKAIKYGYKNHLCYIYAYGFNNNAVIQSQMLSGEYQLEYFQKGINIGQDLGNYNFLFSAYKNCVTYFEGRGHHEYVGYYNNCCLELLKIEKNKVEEGNIYNGLGYHNVVNEQFVTANGYFNHALKIMYEQELTENVAETLYNMAINCILAEQYDKAFDYLQLTIKIIEILDIHMMRVCNVSKIYGLAALCNYHLGIEYNCYVYLNKMVFVIYHLLYPEGEPNYYLWDDDLFLYYFVSALLHGKDNEFTEAQVAMDKAKFHMNRSKGNLFFSFPMWSLQQAKLYRMMRNEKKARKILEAGIDFCNEKGYYIRAGLLKLELEKQVATPKNWNLGLKELDQKMIIDLARHTSVEADLDNKEKDINFLSVWQEMLNDEEYNTNTLYKNAFSAIQNTFKFDLAFYFRMDNEEIQLEYQTTGQELTKEEMDVIGAFFVKQKQTFLVNRIEKRFDDYQEILSIFGKNKVVTLVGIPHMENEKIHSIMLGIVFMHRNFTAHRTLLNEGNLTIIKFAFAQLIGTVDRLKTREEMQRMNVELKNVNSRLQEIAIRDLLTGLYNRQGFRHIIDSLQIVEEVEKDGVMMYIDLDNFKYYNDSFGHDIGDLVLISFAKIFEKIVKNKGFIVRYGGDEFILFFRGKNTEFAKRIAEEIYEKIEDGFKEIIEKQLGQTINIPMDKMVSCSIGIAKITGYKSEDLYQAVSQADEALYYVKRTTKNNYIIWDDIPKKQ